MKTEIRNYKMPFGKFKGRPLEEVPLKYLDWLIGEKNLSAQMPITYKHISKYLEDPVIKRELETQLDE